MCYHEHCPKHYYEDGSYIGICLDCGKHFAYDSIKSRPAIWGDKPIDGGIIKWLIGDDYQDGEEKK
jgi:hypothetical protein